MNSKDKNQGIKRGKFIDEITALRGFSVLIVIICHYELPFSRSGFIGVDIFFVISGYLITGILIKEYNNSQIQNNGIGKISLRSFYSRRIRRIAPASASTLILVWIYFQLFGNSIRKSQVNSDFIWSITAFANNHFQMISTDYFAANMAQSPLLHFWSLSVEEQFYFVWPFLILSAISIHQFKIFGTYVRWPDRVLLLTIALTSTSFIFFIIAFADNPISAYFMTATRAWELGIGAIFAVLAQAKVRILPRVELKHLHLVSTFVMFASLAFVTESNFGYTLIFPVLSAGLFLYTTSLDLEPFRQWNGILCNKFTKFLGKISFSLYLYHFPVYIIFKEKFQSLDVFQFLFMVFTTFILSILSYKFIETPFLSGKFSVKDSRKIDMEKNTPRRQNRLKYPAIATAVICGLTFAPTYAQEISSVGKSASEWSAPDLSLLFPDGSLESTLDFGTSGTEVSSPDMNQDSNEMTSEKWNQILSSSAKDGTIPSAIYEDLVSFSQEQNKYEIMCFKGVPQPCTIYDPPTADKNVLLLGDSRMMMLLPPVVETFKRKGNWKVTNWALYDCPVIPFSGISKRQPACVDRQKYIEDNLMKLRPDLIMISERQYKENTYYKNLVGFLRAKGIADKVLVVVPFGYLEKAPEQCLDKNGNYEIDCFRTARDTNYKLFTIASIFNSEKISNFNFQNILCTSSLLCPPVIRGEYVYRDVSHISSSFSESIGDILSFNINSNLPISLQ